MAWKVPDHGSRKFSGTPAAFRALRRERSRHHAARRHLQRRSAREREQQHAFGRDAGEQQVGDACQCVCLAGAGAGDDQQRPALRPPPARRSPCVTAAVWAGFNVAKAGPVDMVQRTNCGANAQYRG